MENAATLKHPPLMLKIGNFLFTYRNKIFPLIYLVAFLIFPPSESHELRTLGFIVAGIGQLTRAAVIGFAYIKRGGLNKKVYADNLVTTGFFGVCRNPLYVGNILMVIGLLLIHGNPELIIIGSALFVFIYYCIVFAEENYLQDKFGGGFAEYCRDVPRWIPEFKNFKSSTEGMEFNFRRVLLKDYSTFASWSAFAILLVMYENYLDDISFWEAENMYAILALVAVVGFAYGIKYLKKSGKLVE